MDRREDDPVLSAFPLRTAGLGGQGQLFSGKVLADAGLLEGRELSWLPSYGPEMRGGTANCNVILSDTPVGSPIVQHPNVLMVMNNPSLDKYEDTVAPGGKIFVDSTLIGRKVRRTDVAAEFIPAAGLAGAALARPYLESFFPPLLPLPGVKLGLANIVTVYALYALGASSALAILVVRCLLGSLFAGNASALLFSLLGGLAAMLVMIALHALPRLSVYGVSVGGAAAHNCGQVAAAMLTLGSAAPLAYLPFLLLVSVFTGALTGFVAALLFRAMRHARAK